MISCPLLASSGMMTGKDIPYGQYATGECTTEHVLRCVLLKFIIDTTADGMFTKR